MEGLARADKKGNERLGGEGCVKEKTTFSWKNSVKNVSDRLQLKNEEIGHLRTLFMHILALLMFSDFCLIVDLKKIKSWENLLSDIAKYPPIFSPYFIFLECITFFLT